MKINMGIKEKLEKKGLKVIGFTKDGCKHVKCVSDTNRVLVFNIIKDPILYIKFPLFRGDWILLDLFGELYTINVSELKIKQPQVKEWLNHEMPLRDFLKIATKL